MKLIIFSDIHGVYGALERLLERADALHAERLVLLGDALYHGPRNGVPSGYDGVRTAALLNQNRSRIMAVRGNCDSEVDQMMLDFPIMAEFSQILLEDATFFITHGHIWNAAHQPPLQAGAILAHGHTHIPENRLLENGVRLFNPGSISLPKQDFPPSFGFYDGKNLQIYRLDDLSPVAVG